MNEIIMRGIELAPSVGMGGVFYPGMFLFYKYEVYACWGNIYAKALEARREEGILDMPNGCYFPARIVKDGYVYIYKQDNYGNLDSVAYTHSVIAGDAFCRSNVLHIMEENKNA